MYAFDRDQRRGDAEGACELLTKQAQAEITHEEQTSSCAAAFFKAWNTTQGVQKESAELKSKEKGREENEAEVAIRKILVVGDRATVIDPELRKVEEYSYSNGRWLFVKQAPLSDDTSSIEHEAAAQEAKNEAIINDAEAGQRQREISEAAEGG